MFGTGADGDQWIGSCPSLEVATVGDSREKALEALDEAVNLWIESCVRRGTLREALAELGFVAVQRAPFTNDVFRIDEECYWRFPEYLSASERRLDRTKGSHNVYVKSGAARPVVIPADRKDLPKYVVSNVRKQIRSGR